MLRGTLFSGLIAGGATGLIDGLWSYRHLDQFLQTHTNKLRFLLHLAACYALAAAVLGLVLGGVVLFMDRYTRLGQFLRFAIKAHEDRRAHDPKTCLTGLSISVVFVPIASGSLGLAYWLALSEVANRKHSQLVVAVTMLIALAAFGASVLLSLIAARPVESLLARLCAFPRVSRLVTSPFAPLVATGFLLGAGGGFVVYLSWPTLSLLNLRPMVVPLVALVLGLGTVFVGRSWSEKVATMPLWRRRAIPIGCLVSAFLVLLGTGSPESIGKAANGYSGLGEPLRALYRILGDWDRDGYSSLLGGGDCDDWNAEVHPGAPDIPDDGIDGNCVGGDPTLTPPDSSPAFLQVPPSIPNNLNILLITIDTIRADHLGAYGYDRATTPYLDALANDGTLFQNAWAHAPSTRYSIPAILTGRYPLSVEYKPLSGQWPGLKLNNTTIAEILSTRGFKTGAILNYWYFDEHRQMNQGFFHYDNSNKRLHKGVAGEGPAKTRGSSSKEQTDKSIAYVKAHRDERFFLWTHYYDPHYDYERHEDTPRFGSGTSKIDQYDHEIAYTDKHIGRLIETLRQEGLYENTAIVVTGDHGEGFGEHGIELHGYHLYAAQTKVPLIIRIPGATPKVATTPAGHVDILPTLANLVGATPKAEMQGRSLLEAVVDAKHADKDHWVFQELSYENNNEYRGAVSKNCHVLFNVSPTRSWELYRLDIDPFETRDRIDSPGPCADAKDVLGRWYDQSQLPRGAAMALVPVPPRVDHPIEVNYGKTIQLVGADMAARAYRGETTPIELTWLAHGTPPKGWRVFLHFERSDEERTLPGRFTADHTPPRPIDWWRAGQAIQYKHPVHVPKNIPPGRYKLWLGIYKKQERMTITGSLHIRDNRAHVADLEVLP